MNFDFTASEVQFFNDLTQALDLFAAGKDLESGDGNTAARQLREALAALAETGYLTSGLGRSQTESGGTLCLMAAMEILAAFSPSLFLSIETSTRLFGRLVRRWGKDKARAQCLASLEQGQLLGAVALSERD